MGTLEFNAAAALVQLGVVALLAGLIAVAIRAIRRRSQSGERHR
jgi:hypothetical protein